MIARGGVTGIADASWHILVVVTVEVHRILVDGLLHQGGVIGDGMRFMAGGAGLSQMSLLAGVALPTSGFWVDNPTMRPVADHTAIGGCAVVAVRMAILATSSAPVCH